MFKKWRKMTSFGPLPLVTVMMLLPALLVPVLAQDEIIAPVCFEYTISSIAIWQSVVNAGWSIAPIRVVGDRVIWRGMGGFNDAQREWLLRCFEVEVLDAVALEAWFADNGVSVVEMQPVDIHGKVSAVVPVWVYGEKIVVIVSGAQDEAHLRQCIHDSLVNEYQRLTGCEAPLAEIDRVLEEGLR